MLRNRTLVLRAGPGGALVNAFRGFLAPLPGGRDHVVLFGPLASRPDVVGESFRSGRRVHTCRGSSSGAVMRRRVPDRLGGRAILPPARRGCAQRHMTAPEELWWASKAANQHAGAVPHQGPGDGGKQSGAEHGPGEAFETVGGAGWFASGHHGIPPWDGGDETPETNVDLGSESQAHARGTPGYSNCEAWCELLTRVSPWNCEGGCESLRWPTARCARCPSSGLRPPSPRRRGEGIPRRRRARGAFDFALALKPAARCARRPSSGLRPPSPRRRGEGVPAQAGRRSTGAGG